MSWDRVEVTGSFLLLLAWLNYLDRQMIVPMVLLACLCHELGHYLVIRCVRNDVRHLRLTAVGAEMELEHPMGYWQEGAAALAGPGVNILLACLFCRWEWGTMFSGLNLILGCFNLMPVAQLDGGRALRCILSLWAGPNAAALLCRWVSFFSYLVILITGLLIFGAGGSGTLLIVSIWLTTLIFDGIKGEKSRIRGCQKGRKKVQ